MAKFVNGKKSDKCKWLPGMCPHRFGCILPHSGPSSQCKIDSPIFFQPQRGRHSWLWFSQSSWLDYIWVNFSVKKKSTLKSSTELDSAMYEFQILPFWNHLKNFTRSLRPSDSHPPVSPPFWRHIGESDFFIFANSISRDHISDLCTGIFSLGSLKVGFPSLQLGSPPVCNFGFVTFRHLD